MNRALFLILMMSCIGLSSSRNSLPIELKLYRFPEVEHPANNQYSQARFLLGQKLFFDSILSRDNSLSCSSCHIPEFAFSDTNQFSLGVENRIGVRNAPSIMNVGFHPYFNKDGGVNTLEKQVLIPIQEHIEMDFNIVNISDRMLRDSAYYEMSIDAYDRYPDAFVITRALACFERTLISNNSRFDRYVSGDFSSLNSLEISGMELFYGNKANCASCHSGFNFSNYSFKNNGLKMNYADTGRMRVTKQEKDRALFKVPTLRNVDFTSPYMHDGSLKTLEAVIEHYSSGVVQFKNKSESIKSKKFTENEKQALVAFLKTLSDSTLKN